MKKILSLKKKIKNVVILFEDGDFLKVRYDVAVKSGLRKGDELSEEALNRLVEENEKYLIKESALRFLSNRAHSVLELKTKLKRKYPGNEVFIQEAIEDLIRLGLLDDEKFAEDFVVIKYRNNKFGPARLKAELFKKGIKKDLIDKAVAKLYEENDFEVPALVLAKKKMKLMQNLNLTDEKKKNRLFSFLKNRGFDNETIYKVFRQINFNS